MLKTAEFIGEGVGASLGGIASAVLIPETLGTSLVATPAITIGAAATGGFLFEQGAEWLEDRYSSITKKWRN